MKTPLFFGEARRRLFGIYSPASSSSQRATLLCHPWGQEYLRAHRSMTLLANQLSAGGVHVMSFDYFGTGDSEGDQEEATISGWEDDILTAVEELKDTTSIRKVTLVGLRLGATLAARVAARPRNSVDSLVLWDPIVSGSRYVDELLTLASQASAGGMPPVVRPDAAGGGHEIMGFPLTTAFADQLHAVELSEAFDRVSARTLVVASTPPEMHAGLRELAEKPPGGAGARPREFVHAASAPAWLEDGNLGAGVIPVALIRDIATWIQR